MSIIATMSLCLCLIPLFSRCIGKAVFHNCSFFGKAVFRNCSLFGKAVFRNCSFYGKAVFRN